MFGKIRSTKSTTTLQVNVPNTLLAELQSYATENDVSINETILLSLQGLLEESIEGGDGSYETVLSLLPYDLLTSYLLSTKEEERAGNLFDLLALRPVLEGTVQLSGHTGYVKQPIVI